MNRLSQLLDWWSKTLFSWFEWVFDRPRHVEPMRPARSPAGPRVVVDRHIVKCERCPWTIRVVEGSPRPPSSYLDEGNVVVSHAMCDPCWDVAIEIVV